MSQTVKLLKELSNAFGPSGDETDIAVILRKNLEPSADEVRTDRLGNVIAYHKGKTGHPSIMLSAHMDEVSFLITYVEAEGFLRFETVGISASLLPGQRIRLRTEKGFVRGIVGTKPPHLMTPEEQSKVVPKEDLFIDIGASSQREVITKGVDVGALGVFDVDFTDLGGGYYLGKAFDDRAGCVVLSEVFRSVEDSPFTVVAVGSVQEELGMRGARTAAWQVDPEFGLALEGTFVADVPGTRPDRISSKIKSGPVISIMDRTTFTHPTVFRTLIKAGKTKKIPYQFKKVPLGGTDAGAIHLTKAGVPSGTVAVPCRYIHGPASILHLNDLKNTVRLVTSFIEMIGHT